MEGASDFVGTFLGNIKTAPQTQEKIRPTKSKHPTPLLPGDRALGNPTKSKSCKSTSTQSLDHLRLQKLSQKQVDFVRETVLLRSKNQQNSLLDFVGAPVSGFSWFSRFYTASFSHCLVSSLKFHSHARLVLDY